MALVLWYTLINFNLKYKSLALNLRLDRLSPKRNGIGFFFVSIVTAITDIGPQCRYVTAAVV